MSAPTIKDLAQIRKDYILDKLKYFRVDLSKLITFTGKK